MFGYGSLIWRTDFPFVERRRARLTDWSRRFWQGSHDHRGLPHAPGRVVTLVRSPGARCEGIAYLVEPTVFSHLDHREKNGYERHFNQDHERFRTGWDLIQRYIWVWPGLLRTRTEASPFRVTLS